MTAARSFLAAALLACLYGTGADAAACPERLGVGFGDTLASIARTCGIDVEALRRANPGLGAGMLLPGTFVVVPRAALPSPQQPVGRPSVRVAPPLVPPATITVPVPAPPPVTVHPQMPPGFDARPQHMRPSPPPGRPPFPHQQN